MTYDDSNNDGRFPDDSRVEVRYPRTRQEEHGDRAAWPWLPGTIVEQCGPDEWQVCVEDRDVAVLRDGRPAPRNTASRNLYYPMCFRDSSEIRRPPPAVPKPGVPALRLDVTPAVRRTTAPAVRRGAVAVTGDRLIAGAATAVLCVVAGSAVTVGSARAYALAEGHGMDGAAALLVAVSLGGLIVGASLALLGEERGPWVPGTAEGMQLLGLAVMATAGIVSGARSGLLGAVISAWPTVAFFGAADMVLELVHRSRSRRREARPATAPAVPHGLQQAVRAAYLASVQAGTPLSQRAMAARFGLSRRKIRQLVPESTASGTGHYGEGEAA